MILIKKLKKLIEENKDFEEILKETIKKIQDKEETENKLIKKFLIKR